MNDEAQDSKLDTVCESDETRTGEAESSPDVSDTREAGESVSQEMTRVEAASISSIYSRSRGDGDDEELNEIRGYRILQILGEGGMGEVFEAEQVGAVRRRVAIKVIKRGMDSRRIVNRFEAERQALAMMDHPGIARIFDAGLTEDHRPFFAMEYVEGVPITEYCDEHRLSIRERVELFVQVCRAVQHAHLKGIIHRDLKPTNILVTLQDGEPVPKVIDFGLAKAMTEPLTEREMQTEMGQLLGTMEYMSPEQADLTGVDIDTRTDVYSLGVVLYQILAGTLPFESKELMKGGYWRALQRIQEEEPERPSRKSTTSVDPDAAAAARRRHGAKDLCKRLSGDLDWIVLQAVAKDRTERYETVNGLAMDLERHLNNEPVNAASPTVSYRLGKFVRRHRLGVATSVLLLLMIIAFGVVMAVQAKRIAEERDRANLEAATAEESLEFMVDLFEVVDPEEGRGNTVTAREVLDAGAEQLKRRLDAQPLVRARLLDTIGQVYVSLGLEDEAEPLVEDALAIRKQRLGPKSFEVAESLINMAAVARAQGEHSRGEQLAREAVAILEAVGEGHDLDLADALRALGWLLMKQDRYAEAVPVLNRALDLRRSELSSDDPKVAESLYDLGSMYYRQGHYQKAKELLGDALRIFEEKYGAQFIQIPLTLNLLGAVAFAEGRFDQGEAYLRRGLKITEEILGPESRRLASDLNTLAILLGSQGRIGEAEKLINRSLAIYESSVGRNHLEYGTALATSGWLLHQKGDFDQAESVYSEALNVYSATVGEEHSAVATLYSDMALLLAEKGHPEEGLDAIDKALSIWRRTVGEQHPDVAACLEVRADLNQKLKRPMRARLDLQKAYDISLASLGRDHPATQRIRKGLGSVPDPDEPSD